MYLKFLRRKTLKIEVQVVEFHYSRTLFWYQLYSLRCRINLEMMNFVKYMILPHNQISKLETMGDENLQYIQCM